MNKINWVFYFCMFMFGLAAIKSYEQVECNNFRTRKEALIAQGAVNLAQSCGVTSYACVNNALLYKLEYTEYLNTELKDLGCN